MTPISQEGADRPAVLESEDKEEPSNDTALMAGRAQWCCRVVFLQRWQNGVFSAENYNESKMNPGLNLHCIVALHRWLPTWSVIKQSSPQKHHIVLSSKQLPLGFNKMYANFVAYFCYLSFNKRCILCER